MHSPQPTAATSLSPTVQKDPTKSISKPKLEPISQKDTKSTPQKIVQTASFGSAQTKEIATAPVEPVPVGVGEDDIGIPEVDGVDGEVMIRYNHYKKKFTVLKGSTNSAAIDAEYFLSFAFPKSKIHVTLYGPSDFSFEQNGFSTRPHVFEDPPGTYWGLDPAKEYWVDIEEDSAERQAYEERQDALAKESAAKRAEREQRGDCGEVEIIKSKTESCSCIEGNPCLDRYACKDWEHRYDVAKRNGWKGFQ